MLNSSISLIQTYKKIFKLALPILAMQFSQMSMGIVDTIMAGQASLNDLAAVAIGASIWLPIFLLILGILTAVTPTVSHLNGANQLHKVEHVVRQTIWIGIVISLFAIFLLNHMDSVLDIMQVSKITQPIVIGYLYAVSWGILGVSLFFILRCLNEGLANAVPVMIVGLIGLLINIFFNYLLIFGNWGFPALGGAGAGWATSISHWLMAIMLLVYIINAKLFNNIRIFKFDFRIDLNEIMSLFKLGLPIGIAYFVEGSIFSVIALFIASLGTFVVASHQIALNIATFVFILPLSLSIAMTILVGHAKGANNPLQLKRIVYAGFSISIFQAVIIAILILLFASDIPTLYTQEAKVINLASHLMLFAAIYQLPDAIQLCGSATLRGLKDTAIPMLFSIVSFWIIGFPLGYFLALSNHIVAAMGASGFWIGLICGLCLSSVLQSLRLRIMMKKLND
ncbi:MAG: MATE family efflux transporter [Gammaproteobacteria bacterium]|nr:MATE family efflux transporter [Gammaproteobacteria bacterium]